eukprot:2455184-Rhodomonas_salina.4
MGLGAGATEWLALSSDRQVGKVWERGQGGGMAGGGCRQGVVEGTNEEHVVAARYYIHPPKAIKGADQDGVDPEGDDGARQRVALLDSCPAPDGEAPIRVSSSVP